MNPQAEMMGNTVKALESTKNSPGWASLLTVYRDSLPGSTHLALVEREFFGALCAVSGGQDTGIALSPLRAIGEVNAPVWTRSLVKPWQLLAMENLLKQKHPDLTLQDWALMCSSHNGEPEHLAQLASLRNRLGAEQVLACPACYPMSGHAAAKLKQAGESPQREYHPCSGKHTAIQLAYGKACQNYLAIDHPVTNDLCTLLANELGLSHETVWPLTVDGCGLPNPALALKQLAFLFARLAQSDSIVRQAMIAYPSLVGGENRLDTRLMQVGKAHGLTLIAKEGADGLLGVGIAPSEQCPDGLGLVLKLAQGYDATLMGALACEWLQHLVNHTAFQLEPYALKQVFPPPQRAALPSL